ncbi:sodium-independent anion transporter [Candidatus Poribacteria bacterium]|nr:sodium-independent anion transporter [Candidatus Poribacteria bacterium]MEE2910182.1 SulP family inorganic anion transporter [Candidatus Poribacteria bacterium]
MLAFLKNFRVELLCGLTVALALIPEAVAFSFIAYVDPRVGLYAAFMMGLITAILGGRPGMISGATGAIAVIFAKLMLKQTTIHGPSVALQYLFLAVGVMGLIQIAFGLLRWGKYITIIPHSVMIGFVNGLAIIIAKAQFAQFKIKTDTGVEELLPIQPLALMIGLMIVTMAIIHWLPKITKIIPSTLVAIVTVTGVSVYLRSRGYEIRNVMDFVRSMDPSQTSLTASLPTFILPTINFEMLKTVLPYSTLAAAVGLTESLMTLMLIDEITDTKGQKNKESIGQGIANLINGFFGGMGGCAMIGQSMINIRGGARGRTSGIVAAVSMMVFIMYASKLVEMIPLAALVGVMFMVSIGTFEWSSLRLLNRIPRPDAIIILVVTGITIVFDLAIAVFAGVIIAAVVYSWNQGRELTFTKDQTHKKNDKYIFKGTLFFGSADNFKNSFDYNQSTETVVIDMHDARVCDYSGAETLDNVRNKYKEHGRKVVYRNMNKQCMELVKNTGVQLEYSIE